MSSVVPGVITALAPILDSSLKSDRSLCQFKALCYYLDRTSDIRQNKEVVFVSFKKGFYKDISPATISSWIKQTVILCYELSDQEAHTWRRVKAHDVRAFAAPKVFQSGVSLDPILSARHWSHNTFTQFYMKVGAWADSGLYQLGSVVAAQQIHKWPLAWGDLYICINSFFMYIRIKSGLLPSGGLFAFWDWTHPSLPLPQSRSVKKGGGGNGGIAPGNRLLATDHGLAGFPDLKVNPGLDL